VQTQRLLLINNDWIEVEGIRQAQSAALLAGIFESYDGG
jgi:hypothetical protein